LQKDFIQTKESQDLLVKENDSLKKEFSNGSKILEHILSIQLPYYNKSRLGFNKESDSLIGFSKVKERLRQRPPRLAYMKHFQKIFTKHVGRNALKCSNCGDLEHFEK